MFPMKIGGVTYVVAATHVFRKGITSHSSFKSFAADQHHKY